MPRHCSRTLCILASAACVALACSFFARDDERLRTDFRTEGFIYPDVFQAVVREAPDAGCRGLVACRASARAKVEKSLENAVTKRLLNHCIDAYVVKTGAKDRSAVKGIEGAHERLYEKLSGYAREGERVFEFYEKDHSAVIVCRVRRARLQSRLESLEIVPAPADKEKEEPR